MPLSRNEVQTRHDVTEPVLRDPKDWKHMGCKGHANFAWTQRFIRQLAPHGRSDFVLANGSMSSNPSNEGDIRRTLIESGIVGCMVTLPGQLFMAKEKFSVVLAA